MSKHLVFSLGILLFSGSFANAQRIDFGGNGEPVVQIETSLLATNDEVAPLEVHLSVPALDIDEAGNGFQRISIHGLSPLGQLGAPSLFTTGKMIVVPNGYTAELEVVTRDTREIPNVVPVPEQRHLRCRCSSENAFRFDSEIYFQSGRQSGHAHAWFPVTPVKLEEIGYLQSAHLERVVLNPLRWDAARNTLEVTTDVVARVTFVRREERPQTSPIATPFYHLVVEAAANGRGLGRTLQATAAPQTLLVIAADSLASSVAPLVDWKRAKGLNVELFTVNQAGGTNLKIHEFLQRYYNTHSVKPTYLLFVGNKKTMPPFLEPVASSDDGPAASDYRYALLSGHDPIPDAFYGRLLADNAKEVQVQVSRWIEYEQHPEKNADWYTKAMTVASNEGSHPSDKDYAKQVEGLLRAHTYQRVDEFYESEHSATAANITTALNQGRSWVSYFGHGSGTAWESTNDEFSTTSIAGLTNSRLPIVIDVACDNGGYQHYENPFGKAWVTQTKNGKNAGAVAYLGPSVSVSWDPPAIMAVGIAKTHFEKPVPSLGGSFLAGQLYLIEQKGTADEIVDNLKWYNLFGDPSLVIRTGIPRAFQVTNHLAATATGHTLTVHTTDPGGKGVAGLFVAVDNGVGVTPVATTVTDANGAAVLALPGNAAMVAPLQLTVTGYNADTFQARLNP